MASIAKNVAKIKKPSHTPSPINKLMGSVPKQLDLLFNCTNIYTKYKNNNV